MPGYEYNLFNDPDAYRRSLSEEQREVLLKNEMFDPDPEQTRILTANQIYLFNRTKEKLTPDEIAKNWEHYRPALAEALSLPEKANESEIYGAISGQLQRQRKEQDFAIQLSNKIGKEALLTDKPPLMAFTSSLAELSDHEGFDKSKRGQYFTAAKNLFTEVKTKSPDFSKAFKDAMVPITDVVTDPDKFEFKKDDLGKISISKTKQAEYSLVSDPEDKRFQALVTSLVAMEKDDQARALLAIADAMGERGRDLPSLLGEGLRRGIAGIGDRSQSAAYQQNISDVESAIEQEQTLFRSVETGAAATLKRITGDESETDYAAPEIYEQVRFPKNHPARFTTDLSYQRKVWERTMAEKTGEVLMGPVSKVTTDKQKKRVREWVKQTKKTVRGGRTLQSFINGSLDPLEVARDATFRGFQQGLVDFSENAAFAAITMAATGVNPVAGFAVATKLSQDSRLDQLLVENPDMSFGAAKSISNIQGIFDGGVETLTNMLVVGKFKGVREALARQSSRFKRIAGMAIAGQAGEMGEEFLQDTGAAVIQAMTEDMFMGEGEKSTFNLAEHIGRIYNWDYTSRIFWATLPMGVISGIGGQAQGYFTEKSLRKSISREALTELDLDEDQINSIEEESDLGKKLDLVKSFTEDGAFVEAARDVVASKLSELSSTQGDPETATISEVPNLEDPAKKLYRVEIPGSEDITVETTDQAELIADAANQEISAKTSKDRLTRGAGAAGVGDPAFYGGETPEVRRLQSRIQDAIGLSEEAKEVIGNRYYQRIRTTSSIEEANDLLSGLNDNEVLQLLTDETVGMRPNIQMAGLLGWLENADKRLANAQGEEARILKMRISDIAEYTVERATALGQGVQIMSAFKYLSPEATVRTTKNRIKKSNEKKLQEKGTTINDAKSALEEGDEAAVEETKAEIIKAVKTAIAKSKKSKADVAAESIIANLAKIKSDTPSETKSKTSDISKLWKDNLKKDNPNFKKDLIEVGVSEANATKLENLANKTKKDSEVLAAIKEKEKEDAKTQKKAEQLLARIGKRLDPKTKKEKKPKSEINSLWDDHIKEQSDSFVDDLVALGVDKKTAEKLDALSDKIREKQQSGESAKEDISLAQKLIDAAVAKFTLADKPQSPPDPLVELWNKHKKENVYTFVTQAVEFGATKQEAETLNDLGKLVQWKSYSERKAKQELAAEEAAKITEAEKLQTEADSLIDKMSAELSDTLSMKGKRETTALAKLWNRFSKTLPKDEAQTVAEFKKAAKLLGLEEASAGKLISLAEENWRRIRAGEPIETKQDASVAATRLAKRIKATEDTDLKKNDPVSVMVGTLFKVAKQNNTNLGETVNNKEPSARDKIKDAIVNKEIYSDTWDEAQRLVADRYKDDPSALSVLDMYFRTYIGTPFSDQTLDQAVKNEIKDDGQKINELVGKNPRKVDKYGRDLAARFADSLDIPFDAAQSLADKFEKKYKSIVATKKKEALERRLSKKEIKKNKVFWEKVVETSNLGGFSTEWLREQFSEKMGLPKLTPEIAEKIKTLADKIDDAKGANAKMSAIRELNALVKLHGGVSFMDKTIALYLANILSGISTSAVNVISTAQNVSFGVIARAKNRHEAAIGLYAMYRGMTNKGWDDAVHIFKTGDPPARFRAKIDIPQTAELNPWKKSSILQSIPGIAKLDAGVTTALNKSVKYVGRNLLAQDAILRGGAMDAALAVELMNYAKNVKNYSWKDAKQYAVDKVFGTEEVRTKFLAQAEKEGLSGREADRRVVELLEDDIDSKIIEDAAVTAAKLSFTNQGEGVMGTIGHSMMEMSGRLPLVKMGILPFVNTVVNVSNSMLDYSPVGLAWTFKKTTKTDGGRNTREVSWDERQAILKKSMIGTLTAAIPFLLDDPEDDDGWIEITASGPGTYKKGQQLTATTGWRPYTIRIGDFRFNYLYSPLAIPLAIAGAWKDAERYNLDNDDILNRIGLAVFRSLTIFTKQSFLDSANTFMSAVFEENPETAQRQLAKLFGRRVTSTVVPNLARQISEIFDPTIYDKNNILAGIMSQIPVWNSLTLDSRLNHFGEEIEKEGVPILNRIVTTKKSEGDPVYDFLAKRRVFVPSFQTTESFGDSIMNHEQQREFIKRAGSALKEKILSRLPYLEKIETREELEDVLRKMSSDIRRKTKAKMRAEFARKSKKPS